MLAGFSGGGDTFLDTSTDLNGTTIGNWTTGDQLDLTNVTSTKLKALKFAAGKLTVTDGTHSATISFTVLGSDGHGGTLIGWHS